MNKKIAVMAGLATLGITAYLSSQLWAQQPGSPSPTAQAPATVKIGMVNMSIVLKGFNKAKVYGDEMEKIRVVYEKKDADLRKYMLDLQKWATDGSKSQAQREEAEAKMKEGKRLIEDNQDQGNKVLGKKADEQMVQMYKEVEAGVTRYAMANGFHMILHYSEPLTDADKYSPLNIQRKLVNPAKGGSVCPLYIGAGLDVSTEVVSLLNSTHPVAATTPATAPTGGPGGG